MQKMKLMLTALCMSLCCSGCDFKLPEKENTIISNDSYHNILDKVITSMNRIEFYQKIDPYDRQQKTYQEKYLSYINPYLEKYSSYMRQEHIDRLMVYIESYFPNCSYHEYNHLEDYWDMCKMAILYTYPNHYNYGYGFCRMINSDKKTREYEQDFYILSELVGKEKMFECIFMQDIEKILELISVETGYENREEIKELIQLFDQYDYILHHNSVNHQKELDNCHSQIKILMQKIILSKDQTDPDFSNSLFGNLILNSDYLGQDTYHLDFLLNSDQFQVTLNTEEYGVIQLDVPLYYLHSNLDIETVFDTCSNNIIQNNYDDHSDCSLFDKELEILACLVGSNQIDYISNDEISYPIKKKRLASNLIDYFPTQYDFNLFLIALHNHNEKAYQKCITIWNEKNGNSIEKMDSAKIIQLHNR